MSRAALLRDLVRRLLERADEHDVVPVVQAGSPVLRAVADPYEGWLADDELARLLAVLRATMRAAPGVGLAAPQVGLPLAIAVLGDPGSPDPEVAAVRERPPLQPRVLVNPRYVPLDEERVSFYEGCLSVVGYQAVVARPRRVRLTGCDEHGRALDEEVVGWPARIVAHETDHLHGTLYLDRAELRSLSTADATGARWGAPPRPTEAARLLRFPLDGAAAAAEPPVPHRRQPPPGGPPRRSGSTSGSGRAEP